MFQLRFHSVVNVGKQGFFSMVHRVLERPWWLEHVQHRHRFEDSVDLTWSRAYSEFFWEGMLPQACRATAGSDVHWRRCKVGSWCFCSCEREVQARYFFSHSRSYHADPVSATVWFNFSIRCRSGSGNKGAIIFIDELDAVGTKRFDSELSGDREVSVLVTSFVFSQSYLTPCLSGSTNYVGAFEPAGWL